MNHNRHPLVLMIGSVLVLSLACDLQGLINQPVIFTPTPNLTLTSVFGTISAFASPTPTQTEKITPPEPSPSVPPPTPTATILPPSATPVPASPTLTNTWIPPTVVPTSTSTPTFTPVSYVGPNMRSGISLSANYMAREPTIDGNFDEWNQERYPVQQVVYGASDWNGARDLSAFVLLGWDEHFLYLASRVRDERYVQNASGHNIYKGDSLELLIDTNVSGDYYDTSMNSDDYQLGLSPGSIGGDVAPEAYLWFPNSLAGSQARIKIGKKLTDDGYRIEARIPWHIFNVTPAMGRHFGFVFSVSDNDSFGENIQQTLVAHVRSRALTNPTTWGDLTLTRAVVTRRPRPGTPITAKRFSSPPLIDGLLAEWTIPPTIVSGLVFGADKWSSIADLTGIAMSGWDTSYLYLASKVVDNEFVQNSQGVYLYLGDSVEVLFDADLAADYSVRDLNGDDYQVGISPGSPTPGLNPSVYLWYPRSKAGSRIQMIVAALPLPDGYVVEIAIPWSVFGVSPSTGDQFGFAFSISDNDNQNRNIQQTMVSSVTTRILTDPTTWGILVLGP